MRRVDEAVSFDLLASMRPRGQTPRMRVSLRSVTASYECFNEAAGADPADAAGALLAALSAFS